MTSETTVSNLSLLLWSYKRTDSNSGRYAVGEGWAHAERDVHSSAERADAAVESAAA